MYAIIWKLRYSLHMRKRSGASFAICWHCASAWVEGFGLEYLPVDAAEEEMSCWTNDE